nr:nucleotide-binding alpha-beta plait domain-containing protein [Tanacetum cinerariifolium]
MNNVNHGAKGMTNSYAHVVKGNQVQNVDERVIWVQVEGVPCKWWSRNTFSRIASRWGTLLNGEELKEEGYHSNRIFMRTKLKTVVFDSFKMVYRGMTCWVRAIEVPGWVPDFEEDGEEGYDVKDGSHKDDMYGGVSKNLKDVKGESDRKEVPDTNFEDVPDKSGSILELIDDLINLGQTMGYDMTGCIKNMKEIIESKGVDEIHR